MYIKQGTMILTVQKFWRSSLNQYLLFGKERNVDSICNEYERTVPLKLQIKNGFGNQKVIWFDRKNILKKI